MVCSVTIYCIWCLLWMIKLVIHASDILILNLILFYVANLCIPPSHVLYIWCEWAGPHAVSSNVTLFYLAYSHSMSSNIMLLMCRSMPTSRRCIGKGERRKLTPMWLICNPKYDSICVFWGDRYFSLHVWGLSICISLAMVMSELSGFNMTIQG